MAHPKPEPTGSAPRARPRSTLNDLSASDWVRHTKSWFVCDGRPTDITRDIEEHPASFPVELAARLIRFFTKAGQTVLDPFAGTGSTLVAAYGLGRRSVGVELADDFHAKCVRRVEQLPACLFEAHRPTVIQGDARDLASLDTGPVDYCLTSPPYWNMLHHSRGHARSAHKERASKGLATVYTDDPRDIGNLQGYADYLSALEAVFEAVSRVLKPGGYLTVVLQNVRTSDGEMQPVAWDVAARLRSCFSLQQELIWCQDQKRLGCWGYPSVFVANVHHHYCLNFRLRPLDARGAGCMS